MQTEQTSSAKGLLGEYDSDLPEQVDLRSVPNPANTRRLGPGVYDTNQAYMRSAQCGSEIEQDAFEGEDALFNDKPPTLVITHEQPIHRLIVYLKASGLSNKEIGERVHKSPPWISQVLRQPFARIRLQEELKQAGRDRLQGILAGSAEDCIWTLVEVRDNVDAKNADRINASNSLLDRYLGRPNQPISHSGKIDPSILTDEELAKMVTENGVTSGST